MKLTNISLAVLVALGLVACGGSDDNKNQTTDNQNAGHQTGGNGGNGGTPDTTTPEGNSALTPERKAPDLTVPDDIKGIVAANKRFFINRTFSDSALGYKKGAGYSYEKDKGTDPANIKLDSIYNYSQEGDLIVGGGYGYTNNAVGAISVGDNPASLTNNTYVMVSPGKYVRVASDDNTANYSKDSKFYAIKNDGGLQLDMSKSYDQDEVVFIANANPTLAWVGVNGDKTKTSLFEPGKLQNEAGKYQFDTTTAQVVLKNIKVFGQDYDASTVGQNLDFNNLAVMKDIQTQKVTGTYQILNLKSNVNNNDDKIVNRDINLGNIKAYNLPFSVAFVTTNIDDKKPASKDIFNLGSSHQVLGFRTVALPQNGRALYKGKSFSAENTGDVTLYADFFDDRAGIKGVVENRKDFKGNDLPTLTLGNASFASGSQTYTTTSGGIVTGAPNYADNWTVTLYGPEAEEAAGIISKGGTPKEVYNTQRGALTNQSNDASVK